MKVRVGVMISGRGSSMQALIGAARDLDYPAEIALVMSSSPGAAGLAWAAEQGVATRLVEHRPFGKDREAHERALDAALREAEIQRLALAGYMRLLTPWFVEARRGRMINIHPSLLPAFPGLHTHRRALEVGAKLHGCTVHEVTEAIDDGPILGQAAVPVLEGDTEETLAARVLNAEHRLYPACLAAWCGQEKGRVPEDAALFNPPA